MEAAAEGLVLDMEALARRRTSDLGSIAWNRKYVIQNYGDAALSAKIAAIRFTAATTS